MSLATKYADKRDKVIEGGFDGHNMLPRICKLFGHDFKVDESDEIEKILLGDGWYIKPAYTLSPPIKTWFMPEMYEMRFYYPEKYLVEKVDINLKFVNHKRSMFTGNISTDFMVNGVYAGNVRYEHGWILEFEWNEGGLHATTFADKEMSLGQTLLFVYSMLYHECPLKLRERRVTDIDFVSHDELCLDTHDKHLYYYFTSYYKGRRFRNVLNKMKAIPCHGMYDGNFNKIPDDLENKIYDEVNELINHNKNNARGHYNFSKFTGEK